MVKLKKVFQIIKIILMYSQKLDTLKATLEDWIKTDLKSREIERALVIKWSLSGISYRKIQKVLNVSIGFIINYRNNFITSSIERLKLAYAGCSRYLTKEQTTEVIIWSKEHNTIQTEELILYKYQYCS